MHLEEIVEPDAEESNDVDFFQEHENFDLNLDESNIPTEEKIVSNSTIHKEGIEKNDTNTSSEIVLNSLGPSVKLSESISSVQSERKPTIGIRKVQSKRPGVSMFILLRYSITVIISEIDDHLNYLYAVWEKNWWSGSTKSKN